MADQNDRPEAERQEDTSAQERSGRKILATGPARRRAEELGIDLASVKGTGSGGRITEEDVENRIAELVKAIQGTSTQLSRDLFALEQATSDGTVAENEKNIRNQYIVLKAILAGPKEERLANPPDFPTETFAPRPPLAQWYFPDPEGYHLSTRLSTRFEDGSAPGGAEFAERKKEEE